MRKVIIILGFLIISCGTKIDFIKTSQQIMKMEPMYNSKEIVFFVKAQKYFNIDRKIRDKVYKDGHLDFFSTNENLFILKGYDMEEGFHICTIWNSKGTISYRYEDNNSKNIDISIDGYYSSELINLIEEWQTDKIEMNMREKGIYHGGLDIYASKISFAENGEINDIKRFGFSEFEGCGKR